MNSAKFSAGDFQVGSRYRNRIGTYEVKAIEGNYVRVVYDDGREDTLNTEMQARIIENIRLSAMQQETVSSQSSHRTRRRGISRRATTTRVPHSRSGGVAKGRRYYQSVGFLALRATLVEAIVIPSRQMRFEAEYEDITGSPIASEVTGLSVHNRDIQKWGDQLRVTFEASSVEKDSLDFGPDVSVVNDPGNRGQSWRINRNSFWWDLVQLGFRLGGNQDVDAIREGVPSGHKSAFDQGLQLASQRR